MGGLDNLEKSRSNFAHALRLDNNNMRALYGFFMVRNHRIFLMFKGGTIERSMYRRLA